MHRRAKSSNLSVNDMKKLLLSKDVSVDRNLSISQINLRNSQALHRSRSKHIGKKK